jgi:hypothetical protein
VARSTRKPKDSESRRTPYRWPHRALRSILRRRRTNPGLGAHDDKCPREVRSEGAEQHGNVP